MSEREGGKRLLKFSVYSRFKCSYSHMLACVCHAARKRGKGFKNRLREERSEHAGITNILLILPRERKNNPDDFYQISEN